MLSALVVAVVLATAPAGFTEAKVLEPAASFVSGQHVQVFCARTDLDLREYLQSQYGVAMTFETGYALFNGGPIFLGQSNCWPLRDYLARRKVDRADLAESILTLVHESVHTRGIRDEGVTECDAMHEMPRVAVKFFHVKPGKQLRALMAEAWSAYGDAQPQYQTVCGPPR